MFAGSLFSNHIEVLQQKNCLLAVFANFLYIFNQDQTFIINKIKLSESLIKSWTWKAEHNKILAIDEKGGFIEVDFETEQTKSTKQHKINQNLNPEWYLNCKITSKKIANHIQDARIIHSNESSTQALYFIQQNNLYQLIKTAKNIIQKNVNRMLYSSENHLIVSINQSNNQKIKIINLNLDNLHKKNDRISIFNHSIEITAALIEGDSLIIGDKRGKIYVYKNYSTNSTSFATKLEWHVHQINNIFLQGEYLYSCGQEGTVVMWHLRQNKKDFLPRIGTEITAVYIKETVVYCMLKDNTISAIDLGKDKQVKSYKTIINPFGFKTKMIEQNGFEGKKIIFKHSQTNNRNLLLMSGLSGSLQLISLKNAQNHVIQILPRNLISRLDNEYPEPHDIYDVSLNKQWTLMCCSTYGVNHNYLHFYRNQGYNYEYTAISKVENPHKGPISILSYANMFITFSENEKTARFWSKVTTSKKSIIQKQEQYFTCSGQINYRNKSIKNCWVSTEDNVLLINYNDELIIVDLVNRCIKMAFKVKGVVEKAVFVKSNAVKNKAKNALKLLIVTDSKFVLYEFAKDSYELSNQQIIYEFQNNLQKSVELVIPFSGIKIGLLIRYPTKQLILQYDLSKCSISSSLQNFSISQVSILSLAYNSSKLLAFTSTCSINNLSNFQQFVSFSSSLKSLTPSLMQSEDRTDIQIQEQKRFENLHFNFSERNKIKQKSKILDCLEKIQLQMYPSIKFGFQDLCGKVFI